MLINRRLLLYEDNVFHQSSCAHLLRKAEKQISNYSPHAARALRLLIDYPVETFMTLEYEKIKLKGKLFEEGPIQIEVSVEMMKKWYHKLGKILEHFDADHLR